MVGLNHELASELLWREFPSDTRGDLLPQLLGHARHRRRRCRSCRRSASGARRPALGENFGAGRARRAADPRRAAAPLPRRADLRASRRRRSRRVGTEEKLPLFRGRIDPDITFLGFDLTEAQARGDGERPRLVLRDPGAADRAALRASTRRAAAPLDTWNDLAWTDVATAPGAHVEARRDDPDGREPGRRRLGASTRAHMAGRPAPAAGADRDPRATAAADPTASEDARREVETARRRAARSRRCRSRCCRCRCRRATSRATASRSCSSASTRTSCTSTATSRASRRPRSRGARRHGSSPGRRTRDKEAERLAWTQLAERFGARRAEWIARKLRPTNLKERPETPPVFPAPGPLRDRRRSAARRRRGTCPTAGSSLGYQAGAARAARGRRADPGARCRSGRRSTTTPLPDAGPGELPLDAGHALARRLRRGREGRDGHPRRAHAGARDRDARHAARARRQREARARGRRAPGSRRCSTRSATRAASRSSRPGTPTNNTAEGEHRASAAATATAGRASRASRPRRRAGSDGGGRRAAARDPARDARRPRGRRAHRRPRRAPPADGALAGDRRLLPRPDHGLARGPAGDVHRRAARGRRAATSSTSSARSARCRRCARAASRTACCPRSRSSSSPLGRRARAASSQTLRFLRGAWKDGAAGRAAARRRRPGRARRDPAPAAVVGRLLGAARDGQPVLRADARVREPAQRAPAEPRRRCSARGCSRRRRPGSSRRSASSTSSRPTLASAPRRRSSRAATSSPGQRSPRTTSRSCARRASTTCSTSASPPASRRRSSWTRCSTCCCGTRCCSRTATTARRILVRRGRCRTSATASRCSSTSLGGHGAGRRRRRCSAR